MSEHGMPDGRRTQRTKGVSRSLPEGHVITPDPRHHKSKPPTPAQTQSVMDFVEAQEAEPTTLADFVSAEREKAGEPTKRRAKTTGDV